MTFDEEIAQLRRLAGLTEAGFGDIVKNHLAGRPLNTGMQQQPAQPQQQRPAQAQPQQGQQQPAQAQQGQYRGTIDPYVIQPYNGQWVLKGNFTDASGRVQQGWTTTPLLNIDFVNKVATTQNSKYKLGRMS